MDLLGEDLAKCSAENGEVLREDEDLATIDGSPAGDDAIGVRTFFDATVMRTMTSQHVEFME